MLWLLQTISPAIDLNRSSDLQLWGWRKWSMDQNCGDVHTFASFSGNARAVLGCAIASTPKISLSTLIQWAAAWFYKHQYIQSAVQRRYATKTAPSSFQSNVAVTGAQCFWLLSVGSVVPTPEVMALEVMCGIIFTFLLSISLSSCALPQYPSIQSSPISLLSPPPSRYRSAPPSPSPPALFLFIPIPSLFYPHLSIPALSLFDTNDFIYFSYQWWDFFIFIFWTIQLELENCKEKGPHWGYIWKSKAAKMPANDRMRNLIYRLCLLTDHLLPGSSIII